MKQPTHFPRPIIHGWLLLAVVVAARTASAVMVDMVVTPLGASYRYAVSVNNDSVEDLAIVSISDAPLDDPLIDPTLTAPADFFGSYDGGAGYIDFLPVLDVFPAGVTVSGFSFESLAGPGANFTTFEALDLSGNFFSGDINVRVVEAVPETGGTFPLVSLGFVSLAFAQRKFLPRHNTQPKAQS